MDLESRGLGLSFDSRTYNLNILRKVTSSVLALVSVQNSITIAGVRLLSLNRPAWKFGPWLMSEKLGFW